MMSETHNLYNFGTMFTAHQQWTIFPIVNVQLLLGKCRFIFTKCTPATKLSKKK